MSSFEKITEQIKEEISRSTITEPITVAGKGAVVTNPDGTPIVTVVGVRGTIVSKPGTEAVTLDASTFQMMECVSNTPGREKPRYTIVEKGKLPKYGNQFATVGGERAHVITREVYILLLNVLRNTGAQLNKLTDNVERANERADLYKLTVDALRKNGIID